MEGCMEGRAGEWARGSCTLGWVTLVCCSELADVGCVNW